MKLNGLVLAMAALMVVLPGCVDREGQAQAEKVEKVVTDTSVSVDVINRAPTDVPRVLDLTGSVATDDDVEVSVKAPGRLIAVYVKEGQSVGVGQVIAIQEGREAQARLSQALASVSAASAAYRQALRDAKVTPERSSAAVRASEARVRQAQAALDKAIKGSRSEERAQAKANVDRAKSDLELARKNLDRSIRLEKEGAIATAQLEIDQNRFEVAQAAYTGAVEQYNLILEATRPEDIEQLKEGVRQAQEQLKLDRANQKLDPAAQDRVDAARAQVDAAEDSVRLARIGIEDLTVRSPMAGRISGKPLQTGTLVSPGVPIARLIGTGGVFFEADIPEKDVSMIQPGMAVDSTIDALKGERFTGKVISVSPLASNLGRLYKVRVSINELAGKIKPGMFVRGKISLGNYSDVMVVPLSVLIRDGEKTSVFVVADLVAKRTEVRLVKVDGEFAIIQGLQASDQIVSRGQSLLFDGAKVKIGSEPATEKGDEENKETGE
jgi:RND family efflux transporter MFP subunit